MTQVILIVDDDPLIRKLITTTLHDVSDSRLLEAGDGVQALETALRERPQIVFLDYDMPRMGGVETCRRLRSDPGHGRRHDRHADGDGRRAGEGARASRPAPTSSSPSRSPPCGCCGSSTTSAQRAPA